MSEAPPQLAKRSLSIPSTISPEARAFIRNAPAVKPRVLSPDAIEAVRQDYRETFAPTAQAMRDLYLDRVEDVEIAGVRVQVCTPKRLDPARSGQALLYFFGGGYVVGSPTEDLTLTARLADSLGLEIYAPYYRLAPEHPYPAALDDGMAVLEALVDDSSPGGLALAGESAGGNLALATTLRARDEGTSLPCAVALMSPWADLTGSSESAHSHRGVDPTFAAETSDLAEAKAYGGGRDLTDPLISPINAKDWTSFPPTLITTGTRDLLMSDSARLSTVMRHAGVEVSLNLWEGMWHVFECYPEIPEGQQSLDEIAQFLGDRLNSSRRDGV